MKSFIFSLVFCFVGLTLTFGQQSTNEQDRLASEYKFEKMRQLAASQDVPIAFYGILWDQNGNAVPGATVEVQIKHYDPVKLTDVKTVQVVSTNDGHFAVLGEKGSTLSVRQISKYGYEYLRDGTQQTSFNFWDWMPEKAFHSDPNQPVVFRVRKKEPPTLVIPGDFHPQLKYSGDVRAVDLVQREVWKLGVDATREYPELTQDLLVTVQQDESKSECTVTLSTTNAMDGVLMSDDLLYVAPVSGYQSKVEFSLPMGARNEAKRFYLKGRGGNLYARIDVNLIAYPERLFFTMRTWANPRGERNLDYDETLYRQYREQQRR